MAKFLSTDCMDYISNILNYISGLVAFLLIGFIQKMQIKKKGRLSCIFTVTISS